MRKRKLREQILANTALIEAQAARIVTLENDSVDTKARLDELEVLLGLEESLIVEVDPEPPTGDMN